MPDIKDLMILKTIHDRPSVSLMELRDVIQVRSVATVHNRVKELAREGFICLPKQKKQPRSLKLTEEAVNMLQANRYI